MGEGGVKKLEKCVDVIIARALNEIPTVPIYYLAKPQPRERAWKKQRGKKTLLSLTLVRLCEIT